MRETVTKQMLTKKKKERNRGSHEDYLTEQINYVQVKQKHRG